MPEVQAVNRRALVLTDKVIAILERCLVGDFCFVYEYLKCDPPTRMRAVMYLMVPGAGREPELVKLYMHRTDTRWDEPGEVIAWNGNLNAPSLIGSIRTSHWVGIFECGKLWTEDGEGFGRRMLRHA